MRAKLTLVWLVCLVGGSFIPLSWKVSMNAHGQYHEAVHFSVFAISGLMACSLTHRLLRQLGAAALLMALAFLLELAQRQIFGSAVEWADVTYDGAGILAAVLLLTLAKLVR